MHDFALKRPQPGKWQSAALAVGMHVLLGLFLYYSVSWQTRKPAAVQVELVGSLPPVEAPAPAPVPPPPEPAIEKRPEPVVEPPPPPPPKPDIVIKEPAKVKPEPKVEKRPEPRVEKKPEPKPEPKVEKKPEAKAPVPPRPDPRIEQALQEKLMKESLARENAEQMRRQAAQEADLIARLAADGARSKARDSWAGRISAKVRGNLVLPPGVSGQPEALVSISLLPDGSVVGEPRMKRSTGNAALDAAILRAIVKSSPLPKPEDPAAFERNVELIFRPLEP
ncbi:energy transducer TonB [Methyloversatilis thermotolerans]|uniref:energy transducer TonB n=1 Tax=Methyloversatilis thermotolerans TaxID=1346290 RepID=UPI0003715E1B|nr:energy transducer TonB [Methyloversatilis thermotolerans]